MKNIVAEIQGSYGPVNLAERVLQKIWCSGDFRRDNLKTCTGEKLEIVKFGEWNKLDGPDFKNVEILIDNIKICGDVEIHFYENDWNLHQHGGNAAYRNVILHVVLFPNPSGTPKITENSRGDSMKTLVLLPYLNRDLEEYALDEALVAVEMQLEKSESGIAELLADIPERERIDVLRERARERWQQKCFFSKKRLTEAGWTQFCHQIVLETLGLKHNRAAMSHLAQRFSTTTMLGMSAENLFNAEAGNWKSFPIRPANHPKNRLAQYLKLLEKNPDWQTMLKASVAHFQKIENATKWTQIFRKQSQLKRIHDYFKEQVFAGTLTGTRFETLMVDAILPALAGTTERDLFEYWFHWNLGDAPANIQKSLKNANVLSREMPMSNGLFQGVILLELQKSRSRKK